MPKPTHSLLSITFLFTVLLSEFSMFFRSLASRILRCVDGSCCLDFLQSLANIIKENSEEDFGLLVIGQSLMEGSLQAQN